MLLTRASRASFVALAILLPVGLDSYPGLRRFDAPFPFCAVPATLYFLVSALRLALFVIRFGLAPLTLLAFYIFLSLASACISKLLRLLVSSLSFVVAA